MTKAPRSSASSASSSVRATAILVGVVGILYLARDILIPLAFAITLAARAPDQAVPLALLVPRFSRLAIACVAVLTLTSVYKYTLQIGTLDLQMIEQRANIFGHDRAMIVGGIVEFGRCTVATIIECDRTSASFGERRKPAGEQPIHLLGRGEAMDEHDRLALPLVEIGDLDFSISETGHAWMFSRARARQQSAAFASACVSLAGGGNNAGQSFR